jgi:N-acetylglucosaminyl-diphospho-decaprenol L-rhamnosyltransferase
MRPYDGAAQMPTDPAPARPPAIAVAVVSWNTRELLGGCLASLAADARAGLAEVHVVDNGSSDGSAAMVAARYPWAQLTASDRNLGYGPAVNLVAAAARSPWLVAANADTAVAPGALARLLGCAEADPGAAIVAPRLLGGDGATQHTVHPFPTLGLALAFNLGLGRAWPRWGERRLLEGRWDPERPRLVDWAHGAFLLIRRAAFDQLGGFDSEQWMYAEDLDLAWRATAAGWRVRYEPGAVVRHVGGAAAAQAWGDRADARWMRSTYAWMLRRRGPAVTRAYGLVNTAGAVGRLALATPGALVHPDGDAGAARARWRELRRWTALHGANLLAPRGALERHR